MALRGGRQVRREKKSPRAERALTPLLSCPQQGLPSPAPGCVGTVTFLGHNLSPIPSLLLASLALYSRVCCYFLTLFFFFSLSHFIFFIFYNFFIYFFLCIKALSLSPEPAWSEGMVCTTAIISKNRWSEEQKVC